MLLLVPAHSVEAYKKRQSAFMYSAEEKELMKECLGSLKERQAVEDILLSLRSIMYLLDSLQCLLGDTQHHFLRLGKSASNNFIVASALDTSEFHSSANRTSVSMDSFF